MNYFYSSTTDSGDNPVERFLRFGTFQLSPTTQTLTYSNGLYQLYGYDTQQRPSPITLDLYLNHIHDADKARVKQAVRQCIEQREPADIEYTILDAQGRELVLKTHFELLLDDDGDPAVLRGTSVDVTDTRKTQRTLEKRLEELNRSNRELENFAYLASHDLQEPLRKITAFGERLQKRYGHLLHDDGQLYLNRIMSASQRMKVLIDSLLDYSRISRSHENFAAINLNETCAAVLSDLELRLLEVSGQVQVHNTLPTVEGVQGQLHQLFQNLISNALKFTRPGVKPCLSISSRPVTTTEKAKLDLPTDVKYYLLTFHDNGIGFENDNTDQIFTLFKRLHGRSEYEGAGIGLSICKRIVENHGGLITASGTPEDGATFWVYLPEDLPDKPSRA